MSKWAYVVTCGAYSDYGISAVFSGEQAALDYCATVNTTPDHSFDACRVEAYPLDEIETPKPGRVYQFSATVWDRRNEADHYGPIQVNEAEPTAFIAGSAPACEVSLEENPNAYGNVVHHLNVTGSDYARVRKVYGERLAMLKADIEGVA